MKDEIILRYECHHTSMRNGQMNVKLFDEILVHAKIMFPCEMLECSR